MNLLGIMKVNICSNALATINNRTSSPNLSNNLIQTIAVNTTSWRQLTYINKTSHAGRLKAKTLDNGIDIQLFDDDGNYLELNSIDWSLTIQLKVVHWGQQLATFVFFRELVLCLVSQQLSSLHSFASLCLVLCWQQHLFWQLVFDSLFALWCRHLAMARQLSPNPMTFTNNKQRMMELVYRAWDNISWKAMDKSWACFFNNLRSIMGGRGDNNYQPAHNQWGKDKKRRVLRSILVWATKTTSLVKIF